MQKTCDPNLFWNPLSGYMHSSAFGDGWEEREPLVSDFSLVKPSSCWNSLNEVRFNRDDCINFMINTRRNDFYQIKPYIVRKGATIQLSGQ